MNDEIWESTLVNALNNADDYVWVYTERHDWWGMGWPEEEVSNSWVDATRRAVATVKGD